MNFPPSKHEVKKVRDAYPIGTRIKLIEMVDNTHPVEPGTTGTVDYIDAAGHLHMSWDNGRTLALIPDVDRFEAISN